MRLNPEKNQTFICFTVFHLFVALLLINKSKSKYVIIILTPNLIYYKSILISVFHGIQIIYFEDDKIELKYKKNIKKSILPFSLNNLLLSTCENECNALIDFGEFFQNSEFNMFLGVKTIERYFVIKFKENNVRFIEDGYQTYLKTKLPVVKCIASRIYNFPFEIINHKSTHEILVQHPNKLPNHLQNKSSKLDLPALYENVGENLNKKLKKIFIKDNYVLTFLEGIRTEKSVVIFTQPLSEDGFVLEEHKIKLYKRIINEFTSIDDSVIIKPHPREKTNYESIKFDRSITIIDGSFPIEILNLLFIEKKINKGITFFSSAIHNIPIFKEIIITGIDYDEEIANEYRKKRNVIK